VWVNTGATTEGEGFSATCNAKGRHHTAANAAAAPTVGMLDGLPFAPSGN